MVGEPVSGGENFPSGPPELADRIWRRYAVAPGMIQTKPMLHRAEQIFRWSLNRSPLSAIIQRRWLPGDAPAYSSRWPELPFARFSASTEKSVGGPLQHITTVQRKNDTVQRDQLPSDSGHSSRSFENAASEPPVVGRARPADLLVSRSAMIPSITPVPSVKPERQRLDRRSDNLPMPQDTPIQRKPMEPGYADTKMSLPPMPSNEKSEVSPARAPAKTEDLGSHLLQRHLSTPIRQTVPPSVMRQSIMPLASQQSVRRSLDPRGSAGIMEGLSRLLISSPVQPREAAIQRTALPVTGSEAVRRETPLPLVRPLLNVSERSGALMQTQVLERAPRSQLPLPPLIQLQKQLSEQPVARRSVNLADTASAAPAPVERNQVGVDIDQITEHVVRVISRRMAVEQERRGMGSWH